MRVGRIMAPCMSPSMSPCRSYSGADRIAWGSLAEAEMSVRPSTFAFEMTILEGGQ